MTFLRALLLFFLAILPPLALGEVASTLSPTEISKLRTKAARIIQEQKKKDPKYKNLTAKISSEAYKPALDIYQQLLLSVDDEKSGEDLEQFHNHNSNHSPSSEKNIFLKKTLKKHINNPSFLLYYKDIIDDNSYSLWDLENKFPELEWPEKRKIYTWLKLCWLQHIWKLGISSLTENQQIEFLEAFIYTLLCNRESSTSLSEYASLQKLTPLEIPPHFTKTSSPLVRKTPHFPFLDTQGTLITYATPSTWDSARNDGERIKFLLEQLHKYSSEKTIIAHQHWVNFLFDTFSPQIPQPYENKKSTQDFFHLIRTLKDDETLLWDKKIWKKHSLPQDLQYISLSQKLVDSIKLPNDSATAINLYNKLLDSFLIRNNYPAALNTIEQILAKINPLILKKIDPDEHNALYSFSEELHLLKQQITGNYARLFSGDTNEAQENFLSGTAVTLSLLHRNIHELSLKIYPILPQTFMEDALQTKKSALSLSELIQPWSFNKENSRLANLFFLYKDVTLGSSILGDMVGEARYTLSPASNHAESFDYIKLPTLPPGTFLIEAKIPNNTVPSYKIISLCSFNLETVSSREGLLVYTMDKTTGAPLADVNLDIVMLTKESPAKEQEQNIPTEIQSTRITAKTNAQGSCLLPIAIPATTPQDNNSQKNSVAFLIHATHQQESFYKTAIITPREQTPHSTYKSFSLVTDKPIYRPGQTVHWQAWAAEIDYTHPTRQGRPLVGQEFFWELKNILPATSVTTNKNGIISGEFTLPQDCPLGKQYILLSLDKHQKKYFPLLVENYKKDDYTLTLTPSKSTYLYGETVSLTASVKTNSGEPIENTSVNFSYTKNKKTEQKKLLTNKQGTVTITIPIDPYIKQADTDNDTPPADCDIISPDYSAHTYLEVAASSTDASLRQTESSIQIPITTKPFSIDLKFNKNYGTLHTPFSGEVNVKSYDKKAISLHGEAILYKIIYPTTGDRKPFLEKALAWAITTNNNGKALLSFTPPSAGAFRLDVKFPSNVNHTEFITHSSICYFIGTPEENAQVLTSPHKFLVIPEKRTYTENETARFLFVTPAGAKAIYMTTGLGFSDETKQSLPMPQSLTEWTLPLTPKNAPELTIRANLWAKEQAQSANTRISITPTDKKLLLQEYWNDSPSPIISDTTNSPAKESSSPRPQFNPQTPQTLRLKINTPDGKTAPETPVLVTIYDKALENFISPDEILTLKPSLFWNQHRYHYPEYYDNHISFPSASDDHLSISSIISKEWEKEYCQHRMNLLAGHYSAWGHTSPNTTNEISSADSSFALSPETMQPSSKGTDIIVFKNYGFHQPSFEEVKEFAQYIIPGMMLRTSNVGQKYTDSFSNSNLDPFGPSLKRSDNTNVDTEEESSKEDLSLHPTKPSLRKEFVDLIKWTGTLITNDKGEVAIPLTLPDNLTTWQIRAWSVDNQIRIGELKTQFITNQEFSVQLNMPRFLVEKDTCSLSATLRNSTPETQEVDVTLSTTAPLTLSTPATQTVSVPAKGSNTVSWEGTANTIGTCTLKLTAQSTTSKNTSSQTGADAPLQSNTAPRVSDSAEYELPILVHGISRAETKSLILHSGQEQLSTTFIVPTSKHPKLTQLDIDISPSISNVILRALPYLNETKNFTTTHNLYQFLPALQTAKTLKSLGISYKAPQAVNANTDPLLKTLEKLPLALKDEKELYSHIDALLNRLKAVQNIDGGWSWFPNGRSEPYITAEILQGLLLARQYDIKIPSNLIERAIECLKKTQEEFLSLYNEAQEKGLPHLPIPSAEDIFTYFVLSQDTETRKNQEEITRVFIQNKFEFTPLSLIQLAEAFYRHNKKTLSNDIITALKKFIKTDKAQGIAWLDLEAACGEDYARSWQWNHDKIMTQAALLKLLCLTQPKSSYLEGLSRYIALNRDNSYYWKSTADTSAAIDALCLYMLTSKEGTRPLSVELFMDDTLLHHFEYSPKELCSFNGHLRLPAEKLPIGPHTLKLKRNSGDKKTTLYYTHKLQYLHEETPIPPAGKDLTIHRTISRVAPKINAAESLVDTLEPVTTETALHSGDILEIALTTTAQYPNQFLRIKDPKPAGCEPYKLLSGYTSSSKAKSYYTELADNETRIFLPNVEKGAHTIKYRLRVERPGIYNQLPSQVEALYAPSIRGNSKEDTLIILPPEITSSLEKSPETPKLPSLGKEQIPSKTPELPNQNPDTPHQESGQEAFYMALRARLGWGIEQDNDAYKYWLKQSAKTYAPALVTLSKLTLAHAENPDRETEALALAQEALPELEKLDTTTDGDVFAARGALYFSPNFHALVIDKPNRQQAGLDSLKKAAELFEQAAAEGSGYAAYRRAQLYEGEGTLRSPEKAIQYYEMAAHAGYPPALYALGARNFPEETAIPYLEKAAKAKVAPAAALLALHYFNKAQEEIPVSLEKQAQGLAYLKQAAESGHLESQRCLSRLYKEGVLVEKDEEKSDFWTYKGNKNIIFESNTPFKDDALYNSIIQKKQLYTEIPLALTIAKIPLPESLPIRTHLMDGLTLYELLLEAEKGSPQALPELITRWETQLSELSIHNTDDSEKNSDVSLTEEIRQAIRLNKQARDGNTLAAYQLAQLLLKSLHEVDNSLAEAWLELLAPQKHERALLLQAQRQEKNSPERSLETYIALAERQSLEALDKLINIFSQTGNGAEINLPRALAYKAQREAISPYTQIESLIKTFPNSSKEDIQRDTFIHLLLSDKHCPASLKKTLKQQFLHVTTLYKTKLSKKIHNK